jgi:hypothetical protein
MWTESCLLYSRLQCILCTGSELLLCSAPVCQKTRYCITKFYWYTLHGAQTMFNYQYIYFFGLLKTNTERNSCNFSRMRLRETSWMDLISCGAHFSQVYRLHYTQFEKLTTENIDSAFWIISLAGCSVYQRSPSWTFTLLVRVTRLAWLM